MAGKMDMSASLGVKLASLASASLEGLKVNLKTPAKLGKIITKLTSTCYITGTNNIGHPLLDA
jgi:hypothetical protein